MYKAVIKRANGETIEIFCEGERDLIEVTSIAVFAIKPYFSGARLFYEDARVIKRVGTIDADGKYTKEKH